MHSREPAAKAPEPVALRHPDGRMVVVTPGDTDDPVLAAAYPHLFGAEPEPVEPVEPVEDAEPEPEAAPE